MDALGIRSLEDCRIAGCWVWFLERLRVEGTRVQGCMVYNLQAKLDGPKSYTVGVRIISKSPEGSRTESGFDVTTEFGLEGRS